jgi:hypothetical protein
VEHPIKGVVLIFECITPSTMCQFETSLPELCSVEQIAGLIYVNITPNFRDHTKKVCKATSRSWDSQHFNESRRRRFRTER